MSSLKVIFLAVVALCSVRDVNVQDLYGTYKSVAVHTDSACNLVLTLKNTKSYEFTGAVQAKGSYSISSDNSVLI